MIPVELPGALDGWATRARASVRAEGVAGVAEAARTLPNACATTALSALGRTYDYGEPTHVFEREWDLLVVLDACRTDAMEAVADADRFDRRDRIHSVASQSAGWLATTFGAAADGADSHDDPDHAAAVERVRRERVGYVTANPHSAEADLSAVDHVDEVWRYGWDADAGTTPARAVTDRAVAAGRERDLDRLVVHYMQPHAPYLPDPVGETTDLDTWGEGLPRSDPFYRLRAGDVSADRLWEAYLATLRYVLEEVDLLLDNAAGERAAITADHGESFGEWGVCGHPPNVPTPQLRTVPWWTAEPTDTGEHEPADHGYAARHDRGGESDDVTDRLASLGYV